MHFPGPHRGGLRRQALGTGTEDGPSKAGFVIDPGTDTLPPGTREYHDRRISAKVAASEPNWHKTYGALRSRPVFGLLTW